MPDLYIVTLATTIDDLPIGVCQTLSGVQSLIRANAITEETRGGPDGGWPHAVQHTLNVANRDLSRYGPICWNVWEIQNGVPTRLATVEPDASDLDVLFKPEPTGCPATVRLYESPQEEWDSPGCGPVG